MSANFPNGDPFAPWNRTHYYDGYDEFVYCPWEDDDYREDPTAPWNNTSDPVPFEWLARSWNRDNPHVPITFDGGLEADSDYPLRCPFCFARNGNENDRCHHVIVSASLADFDWEFDDEPVPFLDLELPPLLKFTPAGDRDLWQAVAVGDAERPDLGRLFPEGPMAGGSRLELYTLAAERTGGRAITATFDSGGMGGSWTECRVYSRDPSKFHEAVDQLLKRLAEIRSASSPSSDKAESPP